MKGLIVARAAVLSAVADQSFSFNAHNRRPHSLLHDDGQAAGKRDPCLAPGGALSDRQRPPLGVLRSGARFGLLSRSCSIPLCSLEHGALPEHRIMFIVCAGKVA